MASEQIPVPMKVPTVEELSDFVKNAFSTVAKEEGFIKYDLKIKPGANIGDGYMGLMLRVTIEGTKSNDKIEKLNVIAKIPPLSKERRVFFNTNSIFEREILVYSEYIPALVKYQKSKGIGKKYGFYNFPKCYFANIDLESSEAAVIMEDLKETGYEMADRFKTISFQEARLVMESLGKLHALSFALKLQEPEIFKDFMYKDILSDLFTSPHILKMWDQFFGLAISGLKPDETVLKTKLENIRDNIVEELHELLRSDIAEPYTILNHGDCWINNFMFHKNGDTPTDIKLLDYQIARYVSPVIDLVYFIFASTDKPFRDAHYKELLKIYHTTLSNLLKRLGEDPEVVFPFEALEKQLTKFGRFGLIMAFMLIPTMNIQSQDVPDLDEVAKDMKDDVENPDPEKMKKILSRNEQFMKGADMLRAKLRDVTLDMAKLGYI